MAPEVWGPVLVALITAGPGYLAIKAHGARQEAQATRNEMADHVTEGFARLHGRLDAMQDQLHDHTRWQVSHTAEHITIAPGPHRGDR